MFPHPKGNVTQLVADSLPNVKIVVLIICVWFVKHRLMLRDTENELVSHCCLFVVVGCARDIRSVIGWCVCSQWEWSEKSTLIQKIKGLLFRNVIFTFCVKVLMTNQLLEFFLMWIFCAHTHTHKNAPGIDKNLTIQYTSRYMSHDVIISGYTAIPFILRCTVMFKRIHWWSGSSLYITSQYIDDLIDKLSQNNLI